MITSFTGLVQATMSYCRSLRAHQFTTTDLHCNDCIGMPPPGKTFEVSALELEANTKSNGKKKKRPVDLSKCKLIEMLQYDCKVDEVSKTVKCLPLRRLYRQ